MPLGYQGMSYVLLEDQSHTSMAESATDDYLRLLANRHRRLILETLVSRPNTAVPVEECLDWDPESSDAYEECARHVDMLECADLVVYDETTRTVSRGQRFDGIEPFVRAVSRATARHDSRGREISSNS